MKVPNTSPINCPNMVFSFIILSSGRFDLGVFESSIFAGPRLPPFLVSLNIYLPIKNKNRQTTGSFGDTYRNADNLSGVPMMISLQRTQTVLPA
jgi:hypothetical protein